MTRVRPYIKSTNMLRRSDFLSRLTLLIGCKIEMIPHKPMQSIPLMLVFLAGPKT